MGLCPWLHDQTNMSSDPVSARENALRHAYALLAEHYDAFVIVTQFNHDNDINEVDGRYKGGCAASIGLCVMHIENVKNLNHEAK